MVPMLAVPGIAADGQSVATTAAGQTIAVDREGDFVRVRTPGQQVDVESDWRKRVTVNRDGGDRLLVDLGARESDGAILLAVGGDILFDTASSAIRPAAADVLGKVAQLIRDRSRGDVYVIGHTDSSGTDDYNLRLSEQRAASVIAWLGRNEGIPTAVLLGRGMGEGQPVADNGQPQGRAQNRRVEVFLATRDDVDLRRTVEVTRIAAGNSDVVIQRGGDRQTIQVNGQTVDVQQGAGGQRVQVGGTVVEVPQAGAGRNTAAASNTSAAAQSGAAPAGTARRTLKPRSPVQCTGLESIVLDGVIIDTPGSAIESTGSCRVTIRNSEIRSQGIAIAATGLSQIEIVDSVVAGRTGSIDATGTATVSARGTEMRGALTVRGLAKFNDLGGNTRP
jgi:outer membrane protein OmpA-like peptidoglycan-associated protein